MGTEKNMVYIAYDHSLKYNISTLSASDSLAYLPPIPSPKNKHNQMIDFSHFVNKKQHRIKKRSKKQKHEILISSEYASTDYLSNSPITDTVSPSYGYFDKVDISTTYNSKSKISTLSHQLSQINTASSKSTQHAKKPKIIKTKNRKVQSSKSLMTNMKKKRHNSHRAMMAKRCKKLFDKKRQNKISNKMSMTPKPKRRKKRKKKIRRSKTTKTSISNQYENEYAIEFEDGFLFVNENGN